MAVQPVAAGVHSRILRVKFPDPPEWDNLESWREQHGWDQNGTMADITANLDPDKLVLTMTVKGNVHPLPIFKNIDADFYGHTITRRRPHAGPIRRSDRNHRTALD